MIYHYQPFTCDKAPFLNCLAVTLSLIRKMNFTPPPGPPVTLFLLASLILICQTGNMQFFKTCNNGILCSLLLISKHEKSFLKLPMLVKHPCITYERAYTLILFKFIPNRWAWELVPRKLGGAPPASMRCSREVSMVTPNTVLTWVWFPIIVGRAGWKICWWSNVENPLWWQSKSRWQIREIRQHMARQTSVATPHADLLERRLHVQCCSYWSALLLVLEWWSPPLEHPSHPSHGYILSVAVFSRSVDPCEFHNNHIFSLPWVVPALMYNCCFAIFRFLFFSFFYPVIIFTCNKYNILTFLCLSLVSWIWCVHTAWSF